MSPPSGNIPSNPSPALQAVLKCFLGFSENDFTLLEPILAESYTHEVLPKSMGFPVEAKEQWLGRVGKSRHLLKEFKVRKRYDR